MARRFGATLISSIFRSASRTRIGTRTSSINSFRPGSIVELAILTRLVALAIRQRATLFGNQLFSEHRKPLLALTSFQPLAGQAEVGIVERSSIHTIRLFRLWFWGTSLKYLLSPSSPPCWFRRPFHAFNSTAIIQFVRTDDVGNWVRLSSGLLLN
jgi:hypothetical protein